MLYLGDFATSSTVYIPFDSFAASTGAPSAVTNFAAADVLIYKNGSNVQRTSANGITVTTTFDSQTGLQMIAIDLSDNTDAGFYAAGSEYHVAVADITIDTQTVRFWAACFSIERVVKVNVTKVDGVALGTHGSGYLPADVRQYGGSAGTFASGRPEVNTSHFGGSAGTFASGRPEVNTSHIAGAAVSTSSAQIGVNVVQAGGTAWASGAITAAVIAADAIGASELAADAATEIAAAVWDRDATSSQTQGTFGQAIGDPAADTNSIFKAVVTDATGATVGIDVAAVLDDTGTAGVIVASLANNSVTAAALATDAGTEIAAAVWDRDATLSQTQGTFGQAIGDPVADTNTIFKAVVTDATGATVGIDAAAILDDTGTSGVVVASINSGAITATSIAADAIGASELAADAATEIATAVWAATTRLLTAGTNIVLAKGVGVTGFNDLDAAGVRSAVGLATANLDTQLSTIDDYIDTEVAAILAAVVTEVADIKAKTDNLPSDPADASVIAGLIAALPQGVWDYDLDANYTGAEPSAGGNFKYQQARILEIKDESIPAIPAAVWDYDITGNYDGTGDLAGDWLVFLPQGVWDYDLFANYTGSEVTAGGYVVYGNFLSYFNPIVSATSTTVTFDSGASATDDFYNGQLLLLGPDGAGGGQSRVITDYVGSTRTATVSPAFAVTPSAADFAGIISLGPSDPWAMPYEGSETGREFLRGARAALYGKGAGLAGPTATFRDAADTKDRITATVDGIVRTVTATDLT